MVIWLKEENHEETTDSLPLSDYSYPSNEKKVGVVVSLKDRRQKIFRD